MEYLKKGGWEYMRKGGGGVVGVPEQRGLEFLEKEGGWGEFKYLGIHPCQT